MDCSQAFSVEKTSKDGLLRSVFAGFLLKMMRPFSPFYSEKTNDTSHQTVCCWAYKKETFYMLCFLIKVLFSAFPLISGRSKQHSSDDL